MTHETPILQPTVPKDLRELLVDLDGLASLANPAICRGQSNKCWRLQPSLDRDVKPATTYQQRLHEERCLVEGTNSPLTIRRHIVAALLSCDMGAEYPEWKSPLWDFVWRLKLHPKLLAYTAMKALRSVERSVDDLEEVFEELDLDEIREDFQACWDKMLFLPGWGLLEYALAVADEVPLSVQPHERRTASYGRFISYAGWLQVCHGNKPILLPCRKTAELMFGSDSKRTRISRYVGWAIEDQYLKRVFVGGLKARQADAYRFAVGRWTCLEKKARPGCAAAFDRAEHRKQRFFGHRECEDSSS